jgi:hypothetical protein
MCARTWLAMICAAALGCDGLRNPPPPIEEEYEDEELAAEVIEEGDPPRAGDPAPPPIAEGATITTTTMGEPPVAIIPAAAEDDEFASEAPVTARRYVYRVSMVVPSGLGSQSDRIALPAAELFVDVSHDRVRARFAGPGWPVPAGSEVRLRRDRPGVYVFDAAGGRPLEPGLMADWFEGGHVTRRGPPLRIIPFFGPMRAEARADEEAPGELVCALLAEWAGEPRENWMRRCERGAPFLWRLGFWRGEQTAGVPVDLPRASLRADHTDPPPEIPAQTSRAFLEPAALGRIGQLAHHEIAPVADAPAEGLAVENESATRAIVTVQGVAIGWVDAGARGLFVGLAPGAYEVGAIRPMGAVVQRGRAVLVPAHHSICDGRCRRPVPPAD